MLKSLRFAELGTSKRLLRIFVAQIAPDTGVIHNLRFLGIRFAVDFGRYRYRHTVVC